MKTYTMKTHLILPQLTLPDSNHTSIHICNSEYQIAELIDWLHPVNMDSLLSISLFRLNL